MSLGLRAISTTVSLGVALVSGACHPQFTIRPTPLAVRRLPQSPQQGACVSLFFPPDFKDETRVVYPFRGTMQTVYILPIGNSLTNDFATLLARHYQQVRMDLLCPTQVQVKVRRAHLVAFQSPMPHFSAALQFEAQVWRPGMQAWAPMMVQGTGSAEAAEPTMLAPAINEPRLATAWSNALFNALLDFERQAAPILGIVPMQSAAPYALPSDRIWDRQPDDD
jgi:hypothetical protein